MNKGEVSLKRAKRITTVIAMIVLSMALLAGISVGARADYWAAYSFEGGQFFKFLIQQTEPAEMGFEFTLKLTSLEEDQLMAEIEGNLDLGQMQLPLYIQASGPDDDQFAYLLFEELIDDFVGWLLLSFFSPSLFLLDLPAMTMITDDSGEWMDIPVEAQQVYLEAGTTMERSFELLDEDGNLLEVLEVSFVVQEADVESYDLALGESVDLKSFLIQSDLGEAMEEADELYVELYIVPEFPLPVLITIDQKTDDPEMGSYSTKASLRIIEYSLP